MAGAMYDETFPKKEKKCMMRDL